MGQEEFKQRTKFFSDLVDAFVEELAKVDRGGKDGVEFELHYWLKVILPLLQKAQNSANNNLDMYWRMLSFLSTMEVFVNPVKPFRTENMFYVLLRLTPEKSNFIIDRIKDISLSQAENLKALLSQKEQGKMGFIQALRQTKYESIRNVCSVIASFFSIRDYCERNERKRSELLCKAKEKGFIASCEVKVTDAFYNKIIDIYEFFNSRYLNYKRACDGSIANVLLALALSLHYETFDYFLVLMRKIGAKIYYCLVWLFIEIKDKLPESEYESIFDILHSASPNDYDYLSEAYILCDTQAELDEWKRGCCDILNVNHHNITYSYFTETDLSGHHKLYKIPQLHDSLRYELGYAGIQWDLLMNSYIDSDLSIPKEDLVYSPKKVEDLSVDENISILPPCYQYDDEPATVEPQPEQLSAAECNKIIPPTHNSLEQETTVEDSHLYPDSKYEFVPENYFKPDCISKGHIEEHYELVDRVKKHGLPAFVAFINFIANEGFIENDDETKALLAYRLTGRMRPEKQKLDKIPWFKEKGEPKELYYVIKYFSPRSKTKFSKQMKNYFENDYFGVDSYSRTAEDVSDGFKDKLEDFFPGLTNTSKG